MSVYKNIDAQDNQDLKAYEVVSEDYWCKNIQLEKKFQEMN